MDIPSSRPLTFLIVEDVQMNAMMIQMMLTKAGQQSKMAADGPPALEMLESESIDVVLMDNHMPEMEGTEVTQKIRSHSNPEIACLPVIGVTADDFEDTTNALLEAGCDAVLTKPMNPEKLAEVLQGLADRLP